MIYLSLGEGVRQGIPLYQGLYDNKPPLLYLLAAISGSLFWFKVILAFWNLGTIIIFWKFTQALYPNKIRLQKIAVSVFGLLTTLPLLEGNIANAEVFMIGPIILAFWLLFSKRHTPKNLVLSGILFSLASLFKIPAIFDFPVIIIFWLITLGLGQKNLKTTLQKSLSLALGLAIPFALTFVWYFLKGAGKEYFTAAFLQNLGYLSSWRASSSSTPFLVKNLPLFIRLTVVFAGLIIIYWKKKRLSSQFIFITIWLLFGLFAVTLSERPYPHYLIQIVGPISFLLGILFTDKTLLQSLTIIPLALAFFVPVYYKFWYYPTVSYYSNFLKFGVGRQNKNQYFQLFGQQVLRNYEVAAFISRITQKEDKIFVWEDGPSVYALTRRLPPIKFVAGYHIKDFSSLKEVANLLEKNPPKIVVYLPNSTNFSELKNLLERKYLLLTDIQGAGVWKINEAKK